MLSICISFTQKIKITLSLLNNLDKSYLNLLVVKKNLLYDLCSFPFL